MVDIKTLLPELKKLVSSLSEDLLQRVTDNSEINAGLKNAYDQIEKGGRTSQAYEVWLEDYLDQVAVAWVLACVFVRFMEDNDLIDECWLAGEGDRRKRAEDAHTLYFREHPHDSDRDYFEHVFREVGKIPAATDLFAEGKTPLWAVGPTGDAARSLLKFWQDFDNDSGHLHRTFKVEDGDTRFLGDLYQELSERAKKKYALLQTPVFVEEFILDRTLTPAIDEFGLKTVRMIDPTCGSGHFLLGGFSRLFDLWSNPEYSSGNAEDDAQKALHGIWGVDVNPFAIAIARFRLIVAAVHSCGIRRLKTAPGWDIHLATGDSLLFGKRFGSEAKQQLLRPVGKKDDPTAAQEFWAPEIYACEDKNTVTEVLGQQYHVVVGNPPYITVKDKSLNKAYRERYSTCHRQYSLAVPFTERFFDLCLSGRNGSTGFIGKITANSFMKREFGKKLIEKLFSGIDLTHVIDTSGAYIPGHGTPTVILLGRNREPQQETVRAVLGIQGEPSTPADPGLGLVWQSIIRQIDKTDSEDDFTSTSDVPRRTFSKHPWSIGGGGAAEIGQTIEVGHEKLGDLVETLGLHFMTRADDVYRTDARTLIRSGIPESHLCPDVEGESIRDWSITRLHNVLFPYDETHGPISEACDSPVIRFLWPYRELLWSRREPNGNHREIGLTWYEWSRFQKERCRSLLTIGYSKIATHNHFVLDRRGMLFNCSAPIIKLNDDADVTAHLSLLGLLNSSTGCFWMKQVLFPKGGDHVGTEGARVRRTQWDERYEFAGVQLHSFPVPKTRPTDLAQQLDALSADVVRLSPDNLIADTLPTEELLSEACQQVAALRRQMVAIQEELDWLCYQLYGLHDESITYHADDLPEVGLGQRTFEIVLARQMAKGKLQTSWFERHGSTPISELPAEWPQGYRKIIERRIDAIESNKSVRLIEKPEYKRRWNDEPWSKQQDRALRLWLLDRLESQRYWPDNQAEQSTLQTAAELSDKASHDEEFNHVAALYRQRSDFDLSALVAELVEAEAVPFLPILRYKTPGLRKRAVWERTWDLQRQEDAGNDVGDIPVPPKYTTGDFKKTDYWRLRGKLDVPKERWVSYLHCEREGDPSTVVGWAGWNHLQQATALVAYYDARKREGWTAERLTPLLAGLDQLLPWIHQWHPEIDPEYNETAGTSFQTLLESEAQELELTLEDIRNWTPPKKTKKKAGRRKAKE